MTKPRAVAVCLIALLSLAACADAETGDEAAPADAAPASEVPAVEEAHGTLDEARAMLDRAEAHYEEVGRDQALADFTAGDPRFTDRDLYVFCYGPDGVISAHGADESLLGTPVDELVDVDGTHFGTEIVAIADADPEGGLAHYRWMNPATGEVEAKVSAVRYVGDDICGVGAYDPEGETEDGPEGDGMGGAGGA